MSNSGRWRRRTRSVAPSPATSSPSSPGLREAQPFRLPQWKFSQVLGELPPAAEARRDGAPRPQDDDDADEISAIEFDGRGEYLAGGDNAGRVILFRRTDDDGDGDDARPRAELERTDRAGAPPPRYSYATEFQSHEREFDVLDSLDISERIKKVRWCARPNSSLLMLAANDRTVKLWKGRSPNTRRRRRRKGTVSRVGAPRRGVVRLQSLTNVLKRQQAMSETATLRNAGESSAALTSSTSTPSRPTVTGRRWCPRTTCGSTCGTRR